MAAIGVKSKYGCCRGICSGLIKKLTIPPYNLIPPIVQNFNFI